MPGKANFTPPYARIGEITRYVARILSVGSLGDSRGLRDDLDRFANERNFDPSRRNEIIDHAILLPLQEVLGDLYARQLIDALVGFLDWYQDLVLTVPVDALRREAVIPILVDYAAVPFINGVMDELRDQVGGPPTVDFLLGYGGPVAAVIRWIDASIIEGEAAFDILYANSQGNDQSGVGEDERLATARRWVKGEPAELASISRIIHALEESSSFCGQSSLIGLWLTLAGALARIDKDIPGFCQKLHKGMLVTENTERNIGKVLSLENAEAGHQFMQQNADLVGRVLELTKLTTRKARGDCQRAADAIDKLIRALSATDLPATIQYMSAWRRGRWYALSGQPRKALTEYKRAQLLAQYSAGEDQILILRELLAYAAITGNQVALRTYWRQAFVFGLISSESPSDWEVERQYLMQASRSLFPLDSCYLETQEEVDNERQSIPKSVFLYDPASFENWKPNLKSPDQVVNLNKEGKRAPQLVWAALMERPNTLKQLLDAGADPNKLSTSNESALIVSLQAAAKGQSRKCLDLLISIEHDRETLNTRLKKKRESCMQNAIDLADTNVVTRLLVQGVDLSIPCNAGEMPALYHALQQLLVQRHPKYMRSRIVKTFTQSRSMIISAISGAVFDRDYREVLKRLLADPKSRRGFHETIKFHTKHARSRDPNKLRAVISLLLNAGADPNQVCRNGWTPMAFAAEVGDVAVFQLLEAHEGKCNGFSIPGNERFPAPLKSCAEIAHLHGNRELLTYLGKTRY